MKYLYILFTLSLLFTVSSAKTQVDSDNLNTQIIINPKKEVKIKNSTKKENKEKEIVKKPLNTKSKTTRTFIGNISAYTASADECGKSDGITASGKLVRENHTIACPKEYKFGTKIKIEGFGTYICEDRGGAIKGNKFDIYMETKTQAFAFGRRHLKVTIDALN